MNINFNHTLNDICTKCHLENYRTILKEILQEIYKRNIVVGFINRQESMYRSEKLNGNYGRISLATMDREDPLDNIWCLLRCYGHLQNNELDLSRKKDMAYMLEREQFAVDFARNEIKKYPDLASKTESFDSYSLKALSQYQSK
jgi:hypothetical protein